MISSYCSADLYLSVKRRQPLRVSHKPPTTHTRRTDNPG